MKTKLKIEHFAGDVMKVVGFQIDHLFDYDRLQVDEMKKIIKTRIMDTKFVQFMGSRPKPSKSFEKGYHSGNEYTVTDSKKEDCLKDRLDVIESCFHQMRAYDKINRKEFLSLVDSYIDCHFDDGEDAFDLPNKPKKK